MGEKKKRDEKKRANLMLYKTSQRTKQEVKHHLHDMGQIASLSGVSRMVSNIFSNSKTPFVTLSVGKVISKMM